MSLICFAIFTIRLNDAMDMIYNGDNDVSDVPHKGPMTSVTRPSGARFKNVYELLTL